MQIKNSTFDNSIEKCIGMAPTSQKGRRCHKSWGRPLESDRSARGRARERPATVVSVSRGRIQTPPCPCEGKVEVFPPFRYGLMVGT
ncbi:hypothetical protein CDAR_191251 [Caerostris darwini]|uniref:Uncharacterized protein n=1 Tax=Caerostris darwini TaxID=1538125 RepID=A0AAV4WZ23_9ARAC|nr:hypothetical protein CDAR_191251 [Caerostris darwini]